ncbi:MAG: hypothetical protein M3Q55_03465 [Acidobacteriota bacterium]|nr:hypothetical protein [Acidobacteriota bacterium]
MKTTMTQTAFRLPGDLLAAMERLRERDGIGLSEQTRRALRAWLETRGALAPTSTRKQRKK